MDKRGRLWYHLGGGDERGKKVKSASRKRKEGREGREKEKRDDTRKT